MFQVIFIFSEWILIKQIIVFSTPFVLWETDFQKLLPGVLSGELGDIFKKDGTSERGFVEIEDSAFSVHFVLRFQENYIYTLHICFR